MMTAAQTASRAQACKRKSVCVARRTIPDEIQQEVDRRLKTDKPPVARWIARDMKAAGRPISEGYVQRRAIYLDITLEATGRPVGSKNNPNLPARPRKERTNTAYSKLRDQVLHLRTPVDQGGEGLTAIETAEKLGITRQQVYYLLKAIPKDLLQSDSDDKTKKD